MKAKFTLCCLRFFAGKVVDSGPITPLALRQRGTIKSPSHAISRGAIERKSVVPEVKIPLFFSIEALINTHKVVTIQKMLTTRCYIVKQWYMILLKPQVKEVHLYLNFFFL